MWWSSGALLGIWSAAGTQKIPVLIGSIGAMATLSGLVFGIVFE